MKFRNFILLTGFILSCLSVYAVASEELELKALGKKLNPNAGVTEQQEYYNELGEKLKLKEYYALPNQLSLFKFEALGLEYYEWDGRQVFPLSKSNFLVRDETILHKNKGNGIYLIATSWRWGDIFNGERPVIQEGKSVYLKYNTAEKTFKLSNGTLFGLADSIEKIVEKIKLMECGVILSSLIKDIHYHSMVEILLFKTKFVENK